MDLIVSPTSPYARKARIARLEKALQSEVQVIEANPLDEDSRSLTRNPLGKVPSLILSDGNVLFDSPVICAYLDAMGEGPELIPSAFEARWPCERAEALADGVMDAAVNMVMEYRRPDAQKSAFWIDRWKTAIFHGLDMMGADLSHRKDEFDIGAISCAVALGYLDFRLPELDWRKGRDPLIEWYENQIKRESFRETDYG